jgi:hypothetical protein
MRAAQRVRRQGCLAACLALACAHGQAAPSADAPSPATRDAIIATLDDFNDAAAKADEPRYFAHFAPDAVFLGTDATERWDKAAFQAYAHPYFAKGKAWSFKGVNRRIAVRGDLAWFEEDLETPNLGPARGSGVLVVSEGHWLLEQYVLSVTIPNDKFAAVKSALAK